MSAEPEIQKHTPGPWGIAPETNGTELVAYSADPWRIRAIICRGDFMSGNRNWRADTRLIAAAPEMFAALEAAVKFSDEYRDGERPSAPGAGEVYDQCCAAIAKARGQ